MTPIEKETAALEAHNPADKRIKPATLEAAIEAARKRGDAWIIWRGQRVEVK